MMKLFTLYSFDFFEQKGWIDDFDTEREARDYAVQESGEIYNSDRYIVVRIDDNTPIAIYQCGIEQENYNLNA